MPSLYRVIAMTNFDARKETENARQDADETDVKYYSANKWIGIKRFHNIRSPH